MNELPEAYFVRAKACHTLTYTHHPFFRLISLLFRTQGQDNPEPYAVSIQSTKGRGQPNKAGRQACAFQIAG